MPGAVDGHKVCTRCKHTKSVSELYRCSGAWDGYRSSCKECCKLARVPPPYRKSPLCAEYSRRYWEVHADEIRERNRNRRKNDPERFRERERNYRNNNREKVAAMQHRRRAIKYAAGVHYPSLHAAITLEVFGGKCAYCGDEAGPFELDHFVPISRGGPTMIGNMVVACKACNRSKHSKLPQDWLSPEVYSRVVSQLAVIVELVPA